MLDIFKNNFENNHQTVLKSLKDVFGIGTNSAELLCKLSGVCKHQKTKELELDQIEYLLKVVSFHEIKLEQELKKEISKNVEKLIKIKIYRGLRRIKGYPVRGQRTHSNAKNSRKNRRR